MRSPRLVNCLGGTEVGASLVRVTRFELVSPLWKSGVLPLNDTRVAKDATIPSGAGEVKPASVGGLVLKVILWSG